MANVDIVKSKNLNSEKISVGGLFLNRFFNFNLWVWFNCDPGLGLGLG